MEKLQTLHCDRVDEYFFIAPRLMPAINALFEKFLKDRLDCFTLFLRSCSNQTLNGTRIDWQSPLGRVIDIEQHAVHAVLKQAQMPGCSGVVAYVPFVVVQDSPRSASI